MDMIKITDDRDEQIKIGKSLSISEAQHYTTSLDRYIKDAIEKSSRGGGK